MNNKTGLLRRVAVVAAFSGVALALPNGAVASAAPVGEWDKPGHCKVASGDASDLSPSTQKAWADFICGGSKITGGLARMVSGVWIGAPGTLIAGVTGGEMSPEVMQAWRNWDRGARQVGKGAGMVISGVYIGAPGVILDKILGGATPEDLTASELEKVTFLMEEDSPLAELLEGDMVADPMALIGRF